MSVALWTVVIDYRGGTYVRQARAPTPSSAFREVMLTLDGVPIDRDVVTRMQRAARAEESVPIKGCVGVFCSTISIEEHFLLATVVRTDGVRTT